MSPKILLLRNEKDKKIPIYSIHSNPSNGAQFCTAGRDQFIRQDIVYLLSVFLT